MTTNSDMYKDKGSQDALIDWASQSAYKLFSGEIYLDEPSIDEGGFYLTSSNEGDEYVNSYNLKISELLTENGIPDWAPSRRVINTSEIDDLESNSTEISNLSLSNKDERNLIRRFTQMLEDKHGKKPTRCVYVKEKGIVVFFVYIAQNLKIDVVDLYYKTWMQTLTIEKS